MNISWPFLSSLLVLGGFAVALLLHPHKSDKKMAKKCSSHQRFIRKRNTTYKIHTLIHKLEVGFGSCTYFQEFHRQRDWKYFFIASFESNRHLVLSCLLHLKRHSVNDPFGVCYLLQIRKTIWFLSQIVNNGNLVILFATNAKTLSTEILIQCNNLFAKPCFSKFSLFFVDIFKFGSVCLTQ